MSLRIFAFVITRNLLQSVLQGSLETEFIILQLALKGKSSPSSFLPLKLDSYLARFDLTVLRNLLCAICKDI